MEIRGKPGGMGIPPSAASMSNTSSSIEIDLFPEYVRYCLREGLSRDRIEKMLRDRGLKTKLIRRVFETVDEVPDLRIEVQEPPKLARSRQVSGFTLPEVQPVELDLEPLTKRRDQENTRWDPVLRRKLRKGLGGGIVIARDKRASRRASRGRRALTGRIFNLLLFAAVLAASLLVASVSR